MRGSIALAVLIVALAAPVAAQDAVAQLLRGEANAEASDAEQDPAEVSTTRALNAEIVAQNDLAANQERADRDAYQAQLDANAAELRAIEAQVAAESRAQADLYAAQQAEYERRMALWREVSEACRLGQTERCRVGRLALQNPY